jgi:hypothetical protein
MIRWSIRTACIGATVVIAASCGAPTASAQSTASSAEGKVVRITLMDGTARTGTLVALSSSEVSLERESVPLGKVRKVERVSRGLRKGFYIGLLAVPTMLLLRPPLDLPADWTANLMAAGVGAGVGIGAIVQAANSQREPIYMAREPSPAVTFTPLLSSRQRGAVLSVRW